MEFLISLIEIKRDFVNFLEKLNMIILLEFWKKKIQSTFWWFEEIVKMWEVINQEGFTLSKLQTTRVVSEVVSVRSLMSLIVSH